MTFPVTTTVKPTVTSTATTRRLSRTTRTAMVARRTTSQRSLRAVGMENRDNWRCDAGLHRRTTINRSSSRFFFSFRNTSTCTLSHTGNKCSRGLVFARNIRTSTTNAQLLRLHQQQQLQVQLQRHHTTAREVRIRALDVAAAAVLPPFFALDLELMATLSKVSDTHKEHDEHTLSCWSINLEALSCCSTKNQKL